MPYFFASRAVLYIPRTISTMNSHRNFDYDKTEGECSRCTVALANFVDSYGRVAVRSSNYEMGELAQDDSDEKLAEIENDIREIRNLLEDTDQLTDTTKIKDYNC